MEQNYQNRDYYLLRKVTNRKSEGGPQTVCVLAHHWIGLVCPADGPVVSTTRVGLVILPELPAPSFSDGSHAGGHRYV